LQDDGKPAPFKPTGAPLFADDGVRRERPRRVAVVLFNLGGPDRPEAVRPFLFNLFNDPAILRLPNPFRLLLAHLIAGRRAKVAAGIYAHMGGRSPILANTEAQARALEEVLWDTGEVRCFIAMRYWHPMADETALAVKDWDPDEVVLLPLYPQYSTTTTASSLGVWHRAAAAAGLTVPARTICCWPTEPGFIRGNANLLRWALAAAVAHGKPRILFSAHGLPERVVKAGDPYRWQCEQTVAAILAELKMQDLDWVLCFQSRVGPLRWIGPSTEAEVERAGHDRVPLVIVPMTFVSEHSETVVEIGMEYRELAEKSGVPHFIAVPTVGTDTDFIQGLANLVRAACGLPPGPPPPVTSATGTRICPPGYRGCACRAG
jgi:ferrochelatase